MRFLEQKIRISRVLICNVGRSRDAVTPEPIGRDDEITALPRHCRA
jgi:hypothetical protein